MFTTREAESKDYEFLYDLKKAAEFEPVDQVFGWDDVVQQEIHRQEWDEAKPTLIEINGTPVGSYLAQVRSDHVYFGRFFLMPEYQGQGLGSEILKHVLGFAQQKKLPIKLRYLQGNRVGQLYMRFGFRVTHQSSQFLHMTKPYQSEREVSAV
ncbi:GNAT family N-acetyltransferase [Vibrio sp. LaRot3]|uniref:GNAT family N-acetyltransferase n=1 Tax=Vibrio sp. LaRot3 TaxID=2998829 RepID=UPI0022CDD02C|nr:GNAT family N-acetyltransferase [Vibrio sp. LaRot3]MDA0147664.1 GNAT family N-acetyltransferase [Vibrio sp. LaRot3]